MTQLCAWVPRTGMPYSLPASTFDVAAQPPMYAARDAHSPPSMPCARRRPSVAEASAYVLTAFSSLPRSGTATTPATMTPSTSAAMLTDQSARPYR